MRRDSSHTAPAIMGHPVPVPKNGTPQNMASPGLLKLGLFGPAEAGAALSPSLTWPRKCGREGGPPDQSYTRSPRVRWPGQPKNKNACMMVWWGGRGHGPTQPPLKIVRCKPLLTYLLYLNHFTILRRQGAPKTHTHTYTHIHTS